MAAALATLVRVVLLASLTLGAPVAVHTPASAASGGSRDQLRVGSFNIDRGRSLATWRRTVREFRSHVDVAGLQEVTSADKRRFLADSAGWGVYARSPGRDENPVIWDRSELRLVGARSARIAHRHGGLPASYATVVRLVHRASGRQYAVLNVHLAWGGVAHGRRVPGRPGRYHYYVAQVRGLARAVEREQRRQGVTVLVVGDFNVDHRDDRRIRARNLPMARLHDVGLRSAWDIRRRLPRGGTSTVGAGYIDNIWSDERARRVRTVGRLSGGQHHPVIARYVVPTGGQHAAG
ncbi:endonuclease/exonuclease/phosphatase family protein [Nocardioides sp. URHA0020]|uniref:endonuclease/exonuclease/phosphatase family protein n=1 Tax=Nocardioides sp. URHA0020 TaxID=1380392 RepID=UPI00048CBAF0|nr:endonuclease/exonuclease/phosphatase family protein [Nocardioides sp. URHA0020]